MWKVNEKMNTARFLPVVIALFAIFAQISYSQSVNQAVSLTSFSLAPQPVVAGENVTIGFQLYNSYSQNLRNVVIQVSASNPIINVSPGTTALVSILPSGSSTSTSFQYKFHVPSTLQAGEYTIDVVTTYDAQSAVTGGPEQTGQSTTPINMYVYGIPNIQMSATPTTGQLTPGSFATFDIAALNTGTDTARNVTISVLNSANFTPSGAASASLGIMAPGVSGTAAVRLLVASNIVQGGVKIPVLLNYTAQDGAKSNSIVYVPINFVTGSPNIVMNVQSAVPQQLYPGTNQTINVLVENIGSGDAKNLTLSFMSGAELNVAGTPSTFFINTLAAGASTTESVFISANKAANKTSYNLPVSVSYQSINHGSNVTKTEYLDIPLQGSAIFNITSVNDHLTPGGTYQAITLRLKNTGNQPAQQVYLSLQTVYPVSPSNPNFFINYLGPGQTTNVTFYASTDTHANNGTYPITLYEQWHQPNGYSTQQYSGANNYYANVYSSQGTGGSTDWISYVVIAVVVIGGGLWYARKKKLLNNIKLPFGSKK